MSLAWRNTRLRAAVMRSPCPTATSAIMPRSAPAATLEHPMRRLFAVVVRWAVFLAGDGEERHPARHARLEQIHRGRQREPALRTHRHCLFRGVQHDQPVILGRHHGRRLDLQSGRASLHLLHRSKYPVSRRRPKQGESPPFPSFEPLLLCFKIVVAFFMGIVVRPSLEYR